MNSKKKAVALVICLFILVAIILVYIFSELYTENDFYENRNKKEEITDSIKFKNEYESLNGKDTGDNHLFRELSIPEENPFIYKSAKDIIDLIDNKETFIVYFGYASCPWCRSVMTSLIESSKEASIDEIYYVDIKDIRDEYELDENNKPSKTKNGSEEYNKLLEKLDNILNYYEPLTYENKKGKTVQVKIDEKRIYAPNILLIVSGDAVALTDGISNIQTDAYMNITKEMLDESKNEFKDLFDKYNQERYTTSCSEFMC